MNEKVNVLTRTISKEPSVNEQGQYRDTTVVFYENAWYSKVLQRYALKTNMPTSNQTNTRQAHPQLP